MKLHRTLLALALATAAAPAFAFGDEAEIYNLTLSGDLAVTAGFVGVEGEVSVSSKSAAVVDQDQITLINQSLGDGDHAADFTDDALEGASGNIGVNVSAGVGNAQANDAAISAIDSGRVFATAMVFSSQASVANTGISLFPNETFYSAVMDGDAMRNVSGNVGVNVAAGVGNGQSNGMAASVNSSGRYAIASADSEQETLANLMGTNWDLDAFAVLGGRALSGAEGNIGANITAGVGNLQHNGLAIASAGD